MQQMVKHFASPLSMIQKCMNSVRLFGMNEFLFSFE
uniref:Uncharacterized protein n=1 Tax=Rhizophora mucronata TaxID=61149 RepID=A0A2P2Q6M6_RHIMU